MEKLQKLQTDNTLPLAILYMRLCVDKNGELIKKNNLGALLKKIEKDFELLYMFSNHVTPKGKPVYLDNLSNDGFKKLVNFIAGQDYLIRFSNMFREDYPKNTVADLFVYDEILLKSPVRWEFLEYFNIKIHYL